MYFGLLDKSRDYNSNVRTTREWITSGFYDACGTCCYFLLYSDGVPLPNLGFTTCLSHSAMVRPTCSSLLCRCLCESGDTTGHLSASGCRQGIFGRCFLYSNSATGSCTRIGSLLPDTGCISICPIDCGGRFECCPKQFCDQCAECWPKSYYKEMLYTKGLFGICGAGLP